MCHGGAEHGHDAVTDMLVNDAAVLDDSGVGNFEECRENTLDFLSIEQLAELGISREIRKQDRDLPTFARPRFARLREQLLRVRKPIDGCLVAQERDCIEQSTPMSDGSDAEIP